MEISAKGYLNREAIKALSHFSLFRKANPKIPITICLLACCFMIGLYVFSGLLFGGSQLDWYPIFCLMMVGLLYIYIFFVLPKLQYKWLGKLKDGVNEYVFLDESMRITSRAEAYNSDGEIQYTLLHKAAETSKYLFIYINQRQVYLVDKSSLSFTDMELLRKKLQCVLGKKYIVCRY